MLLLITTVLLLSVLYLYKLFKRPPNYPPGPSWLPFIGNGPLLRNLSRKLGGPHLAVVHLAKKYNTNVLGLKLGNDYVVIALSYPVVKTVFTEDEYMGRPDGFFMKLRCMGTRRGITAVDGHLWNVQRNFLVKHLKNLGFGKHTMEKMVKDELNFIIESLSETTGEIKMGRHLALSVLNILWNLMTGSRLLKTDPRLLNLLNLINKRAKAFDMAGGIINQFPWLRFIAPEKSGYNLLNRINMELKDFFKDIMQEHFDNWSDGRDDDLIYAFITEMKKENKDSSFNYDQLIMICLDIFIAGSETTSNTIDFAILMMLLRPDIQRKAQEHIDAHLGKTEDLCYDDRLRIPYIEAIIMEAERYHYVIPTGGPRRVLKDTTLENYFIPKGTTVLPNMHSVNMDPKIWGDPEIFRPERFLDGNGELILNEKLLPFGLGKRRCIGDVLARTCVFLFFTGIVRNFNITLPIGKNLPTEKPFCGITLVPPAYTVTLTKR